MAVILVNDLNVWQYDVPIVSLLPILTNDFDIWQYDVPIVDIDEAGTNTAGRRRVEIF